MALYSPGRRRAIILLAVTSVLLLTLDLRGNRLFDAVRSAAGAVADPFQTAADVATSPISRAVRSYRDYDNLLAEVTDLRSQVEAQRSAEIAAQNAIIENQDLLALEGLESVASYDSVTARLVGQSPTNFDQQVEIDRGSVQGIRVGMAATGTGVGLVGKVTRVSPQSSVIMLVTDPSYAVPVKILAGNDEVRDSTIAADTAVPEVIRETGVLRGRGDDRLPRVSFVAGSAGFGRISAGDTVFTAGGSTSLAPPNIPVGTVANVITRTGTAGQEVEVELVADLERLQFVRIILYQPPTELAE